ncbi:MAG: peptidylprolyl isomerase [Planctomycetota bacterium]
MSSHSETGLEGQVDATNPIEIFWEKNKRSVLIVTGVIVLLLVANFAYGRYQRSQVNETWSALYSAAGLDASYSEPMAGFTPLDQFLRELSLYSQPELDGEQRSKLTEISDGSGATAPLALWMLAIDSRRTEDFGEALRLLDQIKQRFPDHLLAIEMPHPPQWLSLEPTLDDEGNEIDPAEVKVEDRVYSEPVAGSPVDFLRSEIESQREVQPRIAAMLELPEADSAKVAIIHFEHDGGSLAGDVKVRFYESKAPNNVAAFQALATGGYFDGLSIHQRRVTSERPGALPSGSVDFGWPSSVEESTDDWVQPSDEDIEERAGEELNEFLNADWENTEVPMLPMVLAVGLDNEGMTKLHEVTLAAEEELSSLNTQRLVLGRVVEGEDLVRRIVEESGFLDVNSAQSGFGKPTERVRIASIEFVDA